jgi:hypothetical protein
MKYNDYKPKSKLAKEIYNYFQSNLDVYDGGLIKKWLKSNEIEALAVLDVFINEEKYYLKIQPPLTFLDYYNMVLKYFSLCLKNDHMSAWINSRYTAGRDLIGWFMSFWNDKKVPRKYLNQMKDWIAGLYKEGDKELKECIITATLEHLFEDIKVLKFFSDWENDPELKEAYESAKEWWGFGKSEPEKYSILDILGHKIKK